MRNRMNVIYLGKRTTARFPDYLWELAMDATCLSDSDLCEALRDFLATNGDEFFTASEVSIRFLTFKIRFILRNPCMSKASLSQL